jgi:hypothetical protein
VIDCYNTDKLKHFEIILKENNFIIDEVGVKGALDSDIKKEITELRTEINHNEFIEYVENNKASKILSDRCELLNIRTKEDKLKYETYLTDPFKLTNYLNLLKVFKPDSYINNKLERQSINNFKVRNLDTVYTKIKILREVESKFNIGCLDINYDITGDIAIEDSDWTSIKHVFRYETKDKPTTYENFRPLYVQMIKSICGKDFIKSIQKTINKQKVRCYEFNVDHLLENVELNKLSNVKLRGFNNKFYKLMNMDEPPLIVKQEYDTSFLD